MPEEAKDIIDQALAIEDLIDAVAWAVDMEHERSLVAFLHGKGRSNHLDLIIRHLMEHHPKAIRHGT